GEAPALELAPEVSGLARPEGHFFQACEVELAGQWNAGVHRITPRTVLRLCMPRGASGTRRATGSGFDYHERAHRQKRFELVDRAVVDRDASGGPIDVAGVENRIVGAMDSDR